MKKFVNYSTNILIFWLLVSITGLFTSCRQEEQGSDALESGSPVQVTMPYRQDLVETIDLNANTIFLQNEIVRATFQGFIQDIKKNIGDEIRKGDLLLQIRTKESVANDSLTMALDAQVFQGTIKIRAKSNGILTVLNYHTGDFVSEGEEIAIIANPASLHITLNVPYQYVPRLHLHSQGEIFLPDGKMVHASIKKVIPSVDPVSQTQTFLLRLDDNINLPENLNVNARLPLRTIKDALVLPLNTILSNETQDSFWIMKLINDTTAVRVNITMGIENDSLVQIIDADFNLTDRIVSEGGYGLPDTANILIIR